MFRPEWALESVSNEIGKARQAIESAHRSLCETKLLASNESVEAQACNMEVTVVKVLEQLEELRLAAREARRTEVAGA